MVGDICDVRTDEREGYVLSITMVTDSYPSFWNGKYLEFPSSQGQLIEFSHNPLSGKHPDAVVKVHVCSWQLF